MRARAREREWWSLRSSLERNSAHAKAWIFCADAPSRTTALASPLPASWPGCFPHCTYTSAPAGRRLPDGLALRAPKAHSKQRIATPPSLAHLKADFTSWPLAPATRPSARRSHGGSTAALLTAHLALGRPYDTSTTVPGQQPPSSTSFRSCVTA